MPEIKLEIEKIQGVDLKEVCHKYPDSLDNGNKLRSVLQDLYPDHQRDINIITSVQASGIVRQMSKMSSIDTNDISIYVTTMENQYGIMGKYVVGAIVLWCDALGIECNADFEEASGKENIGAGTGEKVQIKREKKVVPKPSSSGYQSGEVIFDNSDISIVYIGIYKFDGLFAQGIRIRFIVENKKNNTIRVEGRNIAANGFVVQRNDLFNSEIDPHKKLIDTVLMPKGNLSGAGITDVKDVQELELEFTYSASNSTKRTPTIKLLPHIIQQ